MNLVERLRAVAAERLTKMDRAACYETEAADRITELEFNLAVTMRAYRMELEKVSEMAQQRNDLQSKLDQLGLVAEGERVNRILTERKLNEEVEEGLKADERVRELEAQLYQSQYRLGSAENLLSEALEYLPIGGRAQIRAKVLEHFRPAVEKRGLEAERAPLVYPSKVSDDDLMFVVERQPHEYAHTCTIQQGPCAACSYLDRIGV
jgi:hypothetical protein